jgi:hypothetical protein
MKHRILAFVCSIAAAFTAFAQVPSLINYQGRLTDSNGAPVTGNKNFAISIYDAATGGNLLYEETIGAVTLDANGVYSFQFGSAGSSNTQVTETIGTTAGSTLTYTKTLTNTPVVNNSITVTDGTNSWSQSVGNPGVGATATANTISGFVIEATITNGGSGYTSAPSVTITGSGTGATATATISGGVVTGITINSAGSGYTGGATITIAPPVIPFRVDYSGGAITATYSTAPTAGQTISATYRYTTSGIEGALSAGAEHWMAVSVDGVVQGARQRVLAAPFAVKATRAETAAIADSATLAEVATKANALNPQSKNWRPLPFLGRRFNGANFGCTLFPADVYDSAYLEAFIPNSIKTLTGLRIRGVVPPPNTAYGRVGRMYVAIARRSAGDAIDTTGTVVWEYSNTSPGIIDVVVPVGVSLDENSSYCVKILGGTESTRFSDLLFTVTE